MKKTISSVISKAIVKVLNLTLRVGANTASTIWDYEPKQPESIRKFKKFS